MIVLIHDLMGNLLNRSAQDPSLAATLQNREEAMMAAATNYMRTLQMMSMATHRLIVAGVANNH